MTAVSVADTACWTLALQWDSEWVPHFPTKDDADRGLAELLNDIFDDDRESFDACDLDVIQEVAPCVVLVCDGCGQAPGREDEMGEPAHGYHFQPDEIDRHVVDDLDWSIDPATGHDYCPDCPPAPDPDAAANLAREPGPNDVPMF